MDDVTVRRAVLGDLDQLAPLFDAYRQFYQKPADLAAARQFLRARLAHDESVIFVAEQGSTMLGFTQLYPSFSSIALKRFWILNDLFVVPEARRLGAAARLLERARMLAEETGASGLMLETAIDNRPAQKLYEKLGWVREEHFCTYNLAI
jgi:GNAT superfamily N-acetyltransferase